MIVRLDAPLYFLNAGVAQTNIRDLAATQPQPQVLLIDLGASGDLDVPTMDLMADVAVKPRGRGVTLMFGQTRGAVRDRLAVNLIDVIGSENIFPSLAAAWTRSAALCGRRQQRHRANWRTGNRCRSNSRVGKRLNHPSMSEEGYS